MTRTTKTIIELSDLTSFYMECLSCGSSLSIPLSRIDREPPTRCPNCGERWGVKGDGKPTQTFIADLALALKRLEGEMRQSAGAAFRIAVEVPSEERA